jgi:hypothetical protein
VNPGASEVCDSKDNNCDGLTDDSSATDAKTYYADADGDGYGDPSVHGSPAPGPRATSATRRTATTPTARSTPAPPRSATRRQRLRRRHRRAIDALLRRRNCADSTVYSYNYDDSAFTGWTTTDLSGGGNAGSWRMSGGYLYESSNAANAVAVGPDMGEMESFTVSAEVYANGTATTGAINGCGLAFGYVDASNYWLVRWLDPNAYYGGYGGKGQIDLYRCVSGACASPRDRRQQPRPHPRQDLDRHLDHRRRPRRHGHLRRRRGLGLRGVHLAHRPQQARRVELRRRLRLLLRQLRRHEPLSRGADAERLSGAPPR